MKKLTGIWKHPKSDNWIARFRGADGKWVNRSTGTQDAVEAERISAQWKIEAARERDRQVGQISPGGISNTVARAERLARGGRLDAQAARDLINELLSAAGQAPVDSVTNRLWCDNWRTSKNGSVGQRSQLKYSQVSRDWLTFLDGKADKPLETVSRTETIGYRDRISGEGLSARTVNQTVKLLRGIYAEALEEGHIGRNPFAGVKNLREQVDEHTGELKKRLPFTVAEVAALINTAEGDWKGLIILAATTGLRLLDGARLTADKLDRVAGTIRLKSRKTGNILCLPIHPALEAWFLERQIVVGKAPIFPSLAYKGGAGKSGLSMAFKRLMARAEIDPGIAREAKPNGRGRTTSQKSFHSLRHFAATQLAENGVRGEVARAITGHTDEDTHAGYVTPEIETLRTAVVGIRLAA